MKRALLLVYLFALCNLTLLAQTGQVPRFAHGNEKSKLHVAPQAVPAGLQKISSNLGPNQYELYTDNYTWYVEGPLGVDGGQQFTSVPFTPTSNAQVSEVRAAVQYITGDRLFDLSIYADSGGSPGTLLAGPVTVTHFPDFLTCCTLASANFDPPLAVTGGTQYWVVASTPTSGKGANFVGGWDFVYQGDILPVAFYLLFGSVEYFEYYEVIDPGLSTPALEVLGTND